MTCFNKIQNMYAETKLATHAIKGKENIDGKNMSV